MSVRRKPSKRKESFFKMYKISVVMFMVVGVTAVYIALVTPLISDSRQVLGEKVEAGKDEQKTTEAEKKERLEEELRAKKEREEEKKKLEKLPEIEATVKNKKEKIVITEEKVKTEIKKKELSEDIVVSAEKEDGTKEELEETTLDNIRRRLKESEIQIATGTGGLVVSKKHIGARTHFPLSIDLSTNTLIVTTPAGTKAVAVLPDKAVENILTKGILSKIGGGIASGSAEIDPGTGSAAVTFDATSVAEEEQEIQGDENIELALEGGELVYNVEGTTDQKLLGFVPVEVKKTVTVSAESGEIKGQKFSILYKLLDMLSQ